jgi:hypothetical protein
MTVRTITDFRELNKRITRILYPIPKISTTLQELEGFTYATALDLNMGYYTIRLDRKMVERFLIIFPWGEYSYLRLPMGYAGSADIFQAEMMNLMEALEYVRAGRNPRRPLRKTKGCSQEAARIEVESQRRQIVFLYPRNRISRLHTDQR